MQFETRDILELSNARKISWYYCLSDCDDCQKRYKCYTNSLRAGDYNDLDLWVVVKNQLYKLPYGNISQRRLMFIKMLGAWVYDYYTTWNSTQDIVQAFGYSRATNMKDTELKNYIHLDWKTKRYSLRKLNVKAWQNELGA